MEPDTNIESDISAVVSDLPGPIRTFIANGGARSAMTRIMNDAHLHIDQAGIVEREIMLLLVGLNTPNEFTSSLQTEAGLEQSQIQQIAQDVNDLIFAPLAGEMRAMPTTKSEVRAPAVPVTPAIARPTPPPPTNLPGTPLAEALSKAGVPVAKPAPPPEGLLADHEEPHINLAQKPAAPTMPSVPAAPPPPPPPVPKPIVTIGLPPVAPPPAMPAAKPEMRVVGETPPAQRPGGILDPYREPIE